MADVGRPTKFTEETRQKLYDGLKRGGSRAIIAPTALVKISTLYEWLGKGREINEKIESGELKSDDLSDVEKEFAQFTETFEQLENEYLLSLVEDVGKTDRKWILTRKLKNEYGDESTVNVNANIKTEIGWKDIIDNAAKEE